jgi:hypothetical protein
MRIKVIIFSFIFIFHSLASTPYIPNFGAYTPSSKYVIKSNSSTEISCSPNVSAPAFTTQTKQMVIPLPTSPASSVELPIQIPANFTTPTFLPANSAPTYSSETSQFNSLFTHASHIPTIVFDFICSHPYITAGISLVALSYTYLLYRCWHIKKYLEQTKTWSAWKIQIPLHILKESIQEEIGDALMADIKKYYQISTGSYDLMRALLTFNEELDRELKKLNTYKALVEYLDAGYVRSVLPDLTTLKVGLNDRIQRILYLKDILYVWMHTNNRSLIASHELF